MASKPQSSSSHRREWTESEVRALLASDNFNYQRVDLPFGLSTGGHDRSGTAELLFSGDWAGQSVADIGSSLGYFLFEAKRRGAGRCVGIDISSSNVRRAATLAEILNVDVEFRQGDVDRAPLGEVFDNVLCLNVLHHLADPILGLNRLVDSAARRLILEVATFGGHDRRKLGLNLLQYAALDKLPVLLIGRGAGGEGIKQFYLTIPAIENLLRFRRGCFARVRISRSGFKGRFLVVAEKRRIGDLVTVSAMPGIEIAPHFRLLDGYFGSWLGGHNERRLDAAFVIESESYWQEHEPKVGLSVFRYDLARVGALTFEHDPALDVLTTASRRLFVTIWAPPQVLRRRLDELIQRSSGKVRKKLVQISTRFLRDGDLLDRYRNWIEYTSGMGEHHILIDGDEGSRIIPASTWLAEVGREVNKK